MEHVTYDKIRIGRLIKLWEEKNIKLVPLQKVWFERMIAMKSLPTDMLITRYFKYKYVYYPDKVALKTMKNHRLYTIAYILSTRGYTYKNIQEEFNKLFNKAIRLLEEIIPTYTGNTYLAKYEKREMLYKDVAIVDSVVNYIHKHNFYQLRKSIFLYSEYLKEKEIKKEVSDDNTETIGVSQESANN